MIDRLDRILLLGSQAWAVVHLDSRVDGTSMATCVASFDVLFCESQVHTRVRRPKLSLLRPVITVDVVLPHPLDTDNLRRSEIIQQPIDGNS